MSKQLFSEKFLRKLERMSLAAKRTAEGLTQGERRSRKLGQSVEFSDFRPYATGDDFRRIDWNAYARLERFFVKLFVEEEDLSVHFLIDGSRSMRWGEPEKLDYAVKIAGAMGYVALSGLDRVSVSAIGDDQLAPGKTVFSPHRGKQQAVKLFSFLEALLSGSDGDNGKAGEHSQSLLQQLGNTSAGIRKKGILVLLSDLMDDGWQMGLKRLAGEGFEIILLHVLARDELAPQLNGELKLVDSEGRGAVEITADYETMARYESILLNWQNELRELCRLRGIQYFIVPSDMPLEDLLFTWMQHWGVLR